MCDFVGDFLDDVGDFVRDVVDVVVDVVEDVVGWLIPQPDIPEFGDDYAEQQAQGILVNKFRANASIPVVYGERFVGSIIVSNGVDTVQIEGTAD